MKYLLPFLFLILSHNAHPCNVISRLNLRLFNNQIFTVQVDQTIYSIPSNQFVIDFLPGPHMVTITSTAGQIFYSGLVQLPGGSNVYAVADRYGVHVLETFSPIGNPCNTCHQPNNNYNQNTTHTLVSFSTFKWQLYYTPSNHEKLKLIKRYIAGTPVQSLQVAELIDMLPAENYKMEIARYAFPFVVDPHAYVIVQESLILQSSKKELIQYLNEYEKE